MRVLLLFGALILMFDHCHSKFEYFGPHFPCWTDTCDIADDWEQVRADKGVCAKDVNDGDVAALPPCMLKCHTNMKAAEDQTSCFVEVCKKNPDSYESFCKEIFKGPIKPDQCDSLVGTGEAKWYTDEDCKDSKPLRQLYEREMKQKQG